MDRLPQVTSSPKGSSARAHTSALAGASARSSSMGSGALCTRQYAATPKARETAGIDLQRSAARAQATPAQANTATTSKVRRCTVPIASTEPSSSAPRCAVSRGPVAVRRARGRLRRALRRRGRAGERAASARVESLSIPERRGSGGGLVGAVALLLVGVVLVVAVLAAPEIDVVQDRPGDARVDVPQGAHGLL